MEAEDSARETSLTLTGYAAKAPVPIQKILEVPALSTLLDLYLVNSGEQRLAEAEIILKRFWEELEIREENEKSHQRKTGSGRFSEREMALGVSRLLFGDPVGPSPDMYESLMDRRTASVRMPHACGDENERRFYRNYIEFDRSYMRELESFLDSNGSAGQAGAKSGNVGRSRLTDDSLVSPLPELASSVQHERSMLVATRAALKKALRILCDSIRSAFQKEPTQPNKIRLFSQHPRLRRATLIIVSFIVTIAAAYVTILLFFAHAMPHQVRQPSNTDPAYAVAEGAAWKPGWGPSREFAVDSTAPVFNRLRFDQVSLLRGSLGTGWFLVVNDGEGTAENRPLRPGRYDVLISVENGASLGSMPIEDATLQLGVLPTWEDSWGHWSVWARLAATNADTVWDGAGVRLDCTCTIHIDPGSVVLTSQGAPGGLRVDERVLTSDGAVIGFSALDGRIPAGLGNLVTVTAELVVQLR